MEALLFPTYQSLEKLPLEKFSATHPLLLAIWLVETLHEADVVGDDWFDEPRGPVSVEMLARHAQRSEHREVKVEGPALGPGRVPVKTCLIFIIIFEKFEEKTKKASKFINELKLYKQRHILLVGFLIFSDQLLRTADLRSRLLAMFCLLLHVLVG